VDVTEHASEDGDPDSAGDEDERSGRVFGERERPLRLLDLDLCPVPYPTRLVAEAIRDQSAERAAAIFYGLCLLAIAVVFSALWGAVARDRQLLKHEVTDDEVKAILVASSPSLGFYGGAIALAIVAPRAAAFGYLLIDVVVILRVRGDEVVAEPA